MRSKLDLALLFRMRGKPSYYFFKKLKRQNVFSKETNFNIQSGALFTQIFWSVAGLMKLFRLFPPIIPKSSNWGQLNKKLPRVEIEEQNCALRVAEILFSAKKEQLCLNSSSPISLDCCFGQEGERERDEKRSPILIWDLFKSL